MKFVQTLLTVLVCALFITSLAAAQEEGLLSQSQIFQLMEALKDHDQALAPIGLTRAVVDSLRGGWCGDFFILAYMSDQMSLLCKIDTYQDDVTPLLLFSIDRYVVVLDEEAGEHPIVRLVPAPGRWPEEHKVLVRMSKKLYDASPCLPMPSRASEWKVK